MDCYKFVELMSEYVEGDLSPENTALWQKHFESCKNCAPFLKSFESSRELLQYLKEKKCPDEIKTRMESLIADMCEKKKAAASKKN